jgi:hypothetical protein
MSSYHVGIKDLKFLVDGFEDYGYTRKGAVEWLRENKEDITPEFMEMVYECPDAFFYYETHVKPKEDLGQMCAVNVDE